MVELHVVRIREVVDLEIALAELYTFVSKRNLIVFLLHLVVSLFIESLYEGVGISVHNAGIYAASRNDKRSSGFIDEDGVDLVDDGVVEFSLCEILLVGNHVVAQIVETELVVCSVSDICHVLIVSGLSFYGMDNASDLEPEEGVELAHPLSVTLCQVVIDCYNMHAPAFESVEVCRQGSYQSLTFTSLHLGDAALMENYASDELHSEVLHSQ